MRTRGAQGKTADREGRFLREKPHGKKTVAERVLSCYTSRPLYSVFAHSSEPPVSAPGAASPTMASATRRRLRRGGGGGGRSSAALLSILCASPGLSSPRCIALTISVLSGRRSSPRTLPPRAEAHAAHAHAPAETLRTLGELVGVLRALGSRLPLARAAARAHATTPVPPHSKQSVSSARPPRRDRRAPLREARGSRRRRR